MTSHLLLNPLGGVEKSIAHGGVVATMEGKERIATATPILSFWLLHLLPAEVPGAACHDSGYCLLLLKLVLLFASLLAIPLARQCCLDAALLTGLQVVGVTLHFLDDVLLLYLPLEPAQRIFERLAFLYANLCQRVPPPNLLVSSFMILEFSLFRSTELRPPPRKSP